MCRKHTSGYVLNADIRGGGVVVVVVNADIRVFVEVRHSGMT